MPAGKEVQPECISQRASSGRLNCSCSRSRDLTAINPVVPEMMKIAALAVSTAPGGNMSFAFSKSVPIAPAKGRGKRTPAWTNRRAKALVPCGFADAKTAKGILQYQNSRKRLSNCPRIPREEVRKYGSFQSGAKYGIYRYEQPPLAKQGIAGIVCCWTTGKLAFVCRVSAIRCYAAISAKRYYPPTGSFANRSPAAGKPI